MAGGKLCLYDNHPSLLSLDRRYKYEIHNSSQKTWHELLHMKINHFPIEHDLLCVRLSRR